VKEPINDVTLRMMYLNSINSHWCAYVSCMYEWLEIEGEVKSFCFPTDFDWIDGGKTLESLGVGMSGIIVRR